MSEYFKWEAAKYSVNIAKIDHEHQKLIEYMNILYEKVETKAPKAAIKKAIDDLIKYTVQHFREEEEFFMKIDTYTLKTAHKKIHHDLLARLQEHADAFDKTGVATNDFFVFLKVWLTSHIAGIDMKYANAYNGKAA